MTTHDTQDDAERLDQIIAEYINSEDDGTPLDRDRLIAEHGEFEAALRQFFADRDCFRRAARPLVASEDAVDDTTARLRYFGNYELLEKVANGGMGVVYKAHQTTLRRTVAVKMIRSAHLATDEDIRRFREEAETAARLQHPAIVPIYEIGVHRGQHYFSMEYIEGQNLADLIRTGAQSPEQAARIVLDVASALDAAHQQGTIHRDVKPSNILIDDSGRVRITDFGLAMRVEGDSELTRTGQVLGTPSYMSPEQAEARRAQIGPASDVYSLGAVLYELLTGRPPFRAETTVATIRQVVEQEVIPPSRHNPRVPRDLEVICMKCLRKEPEKRYGTAALLADDVARWLAGEPILARPVSRPERFVRWCRRNPLIASLSWLSLAGLIGIATVATVGYFREARLHQQADTLRSRAEEEGHRARQTLASLATAHSELSSKHAELEAEQARNRQLNQTVADLEKKRSQLETVISTGELQLAKNLLRLARSAWLEGDALKADQYLESVPEAMRNTEWQELKRLWRPDLLEFPGRACVAVDAAGKWLATAAPTRGAVDVWDLKTRKRRHRLAGPTREVLAVAINSRGTRLASVSADRTVRLWNLEDGTLMHVFDDRAFPAVDVLFDPTGRYLLCGGQMKTERHQRFQRELRIWDCETRELVQRFTDGGGQIALSPDGRLLAYISDDAGEDQRPTVIVRDLDQPEVDQSGVILRCPTVRKAGTPLAFSPDGRTIALVEPAESPDTQRETIALWNLTTGELQQQLPVGFHVHALAFSPEATRIACGGRDGYSEAVSTQFQTVIFNLITGERNRIFPWYQQTVTDLIYVPQGRYLATATATAVKVWDVTPPSDPTDRILRDIVELDVGAYDWPQWGGSKARINTPAGSNIPLTWDVGDAYKRPGLQVDRRAGQVPENSHNIKWCVPLGSQTYGNPVVANGRVFVGSNNGSGYLTYYPRTVDLGVLLCFEEDTGRFLWQHSNPKLPTGRVHDWPMQGVCSTPVVDGDRLWYVSNRGEVVCLDTHGFYDEEDDGEPMADEGEWVWVFDISSTLIHDKDRLAAEFARAGLELPGRRGYLIRWDLEAQDANRWIVQKYFRDSRRQTWQKTPIYELYLDQGRLQCFRVDESGQADLSTPLFSVENDLLPGLQSGVMDERLRGAFVRQGAEIVDDVRVERIGASSSWLVTGVLLNDRREFRLERDPVRLVCKCQIPRMHHYEADVVWKFDMMRELGVSQHNMANCSMITVDDRLFVCTSNGLDESHINLPAPDAPSFLAMDRNTGEVLWTDNSPGANILHAQWASPSYGVFDGQPQVIFPGGDGWVYSFDPAGNGRGGARLLWKFDANPKSAKWILGGHGTRNNIIAFPAIYDGLVYIVVGQDPEHGEGLGRLWCIDPTRRLDGSDVSAELAVDAAGNIIPHRRIQAVLPENGERAVPNPNSAVRWVYVSQDRDGDGEIDFEEEFHRSLSIPVIKDDILYVGDFSGLLHCLNAKTGKLYWTYDQFAACWGSALLVAGHVYIADEDGDVAVFRHSADPSVAMPNGNPLYEINMDSAVYMTPIVANNVLYVATKDMLFAIASPDADEPVR